MKTVIHISERIYNIFLKFYPFSYRNEFEDEMKYVYSQSIKDAYIEKGERGLLYFWATSLVDGIKSLFRQHLENKKGGVLMANRKKDLLTQNKIFSWIALGTVLLLMVPLSLLVFQVPLYDPGSGWETIKWGPEDFILMGVMIFGVSSLFVWAARRIEKKNRLIAAIIFAGAFFWLWAELAVGVFTNWGS